MIIETVDQLSPEWFNLKVGVPGASSFNKILSPTGIPSKQADKYARRLAAEMRYGKKFPSYQNWEMRYGLETEPRARAYYVWEYEPVQIVGLVWYDERKDRSCSPDALVGEDGGWEAKCPANIDIHLDRLEKGVLPTEMIPQIQGSMYITGRKWWDFMSYYPDYPDQLVVRIYRDEAYIAKLDGLLDEFILMRDQIFDDLCHLPSVEAKKHVETEPVKPVIPERPKTGLVL